MACFRLRICFGSPKLYPDHALDLVSADTRFLKPVFVGDPVALEIASERDPDDRLAFDATWRHERTGEVLITSKGVFRCTQRGTPILWVAVALGWGRHGHVQLR
jgi:acyl-CoA thioesterase FadM